MSAPVYHYHTNRQEEFRLIKGSRPGSPARFYKFGTSKDLDDLDVVGEYNCVR